MGTIIEQVVKACAHDAGDGEDSAGLLAEQDQRHRNRHKSSRGPARTALTVHGRTAADMFRGSADWDRIAEIKPHLKRIPLIGNGDLDTPPKVVDAFDGTTSTA